MIVKERGKEVWKGGWRESQLLRERVHRERERREKEWQVIENERGRD